MKKPEINAQLPQPRSLDRTGGSASQGSDDIPDDLGSQHVQRESRELQSLDPDPVKLADGKPGRQFFNQASGGDKKGLPQTPGKVTPEDWKPNFADKWPWE